MSDKFDAFEKSVMGLQVRAFKSCTKGIPAYKEY